MVARYPEGGGVGSAGRAVIQLAVSPWVLERLLTFDGGSEDLEDNGDSEPDDDAELDGPPTF